MSVIDETKAWLSKSTGQFLKVTLDLALLPLSIIISPSSIGTDTRATASTSNTIIKAANSNRLGLFLYNDSNRNAFVKYGTVATVTSFAIKMPPGSHHFIDGPIYTGAVDAIWETTAGPALTGAMQTTELT